jgi:hypothetical protein
MRARKEGNGAPVGLSLDKCAYVELADNAGRTAMPLPLYTPSSACTPFVLELLPGAAPAVITIHMGGNTPTQITLEAWLAASAVYRETE